MGERLYYFMEIIIFSYLALLVITNPIFLAKGILKSFSNIKYRILIGIAALINVVRCLNELLK
ncbi:MAG: hypothetical protein H6Q72_4854 [Firmicutes bacterium]|jgi:hypothetical protein|nr:hypothetical protein FA11_0494 [Pelosinus fermentans A11]MBP2638947.1 hypothetical protein [Bacillota bacterium]